MTKSPGSVLLQSCSSAQHLVIAAPYMKANALYKILSGAQSVISLVCITRWRPDEIIIGASDARCRTMIEARQGSFRLHPTLHAKYYRIDDVVFIGSANLTSSAMGWTSHPNLEILCPAGNDFDAQGFEQELLQDSRAVGDAEYALWEALCKIQVPSRREFSGPKPVLDVWRPATRDPGNVELAYRNRSDEIASLDEQRAALRDLRALSIPLGLSGDPFRTWIATCLLAAPFANSVMRLTDTDTLKATNTLAETHNLSLTAARRDMETVQNWLVFLSLEARI